MFLAIQGHKGGNKVEYNEVNDEDLVDFVFEVERNTTNNNSNARFYYDNGEDCVMDDREPNLVQITPPF